MTTTLANWHNDITIDGQPYPTRHPVPEDVRVTEDCLGDLNNHDRQYLIAIHEAAHAVAGLAGRACVHHAKVRPVRQLKGGAHRSTNGSIAGDVYTCNFSNGKDSAVYLGVGERAEDLWLRQNNLWTPRRAVGTELGAYGDRRAFLTDNPHFGFGADHNDYRVVHDLADQLITQHWQAITAVAEVLATQFDLTGEQIADLAQLPNGTCSTTCARPAL